MKRYPATPTWQFKPFAYHVDGGFGAIGDAFHDAAERLDHSVIGQPFRNSSLPAAYLHRHAAELYLKACIIILHRGLELPFDQPRPDDPAIKVNEDWLPIRSIHSLTKLHAYLFRLLEENGPTLAETTTTDWTTIPPELGRWISGVSEFDDGSTFFRYPGLDDDAKSDFRESSIGEIWSSLGPDDEPLKGYLEFDRNDHVTGAFCFDPSQLELVLGLLRKISGTLSTLHFALRSELARGR